MRSLLFILLAFLILLCLCSYVLGQFEQGYVTIYLVDEGIIIGKVIDSDENTIKIEPISGGQITIYRSYIKEIKQGEQALPSAQQGEIMADRIAGKQAARTDTDGKIITKEEISNEIDRSFGCSCCMLGSSTSLSLLELIYYQLLYKNNYIIAEERSQRWSLPILLAGAGVGYFAGRQIDKYNAVNRIKERRRIEKIEISIPKPLPIVKTKIWHS